MKHVLVVARIGTLKAPRDGISVPISAKRKLKFESEVPIQKVKGGRSSNSYIPK